MGNLYYGFSMWLIIRKSQFKLEIYQFYSNVDYKTILNNQ